MKHCIVIDRLRTPEAGGIISLIQDATLFYIESLLHNNPSDYYLVLKKNGVGNPDSYLHSKIHQETIDYFRTNSGLMEFIADMNLTGELETVLNETVSFYAINYFVKVVELLEIDNENRVIGIVRTELNRYSYNVCILTER